MAKFWAAVVTWWQGKKTIFGGGVVMAAAVAGVCYGKLEPVDALTVLGIGLSICGLAAKTNRHQAELLTALQGVAQVSTDLRSGKSAQAVQDAEQAATSIGYAAAPALLSSAGASLHISASTAAEVAQLFGALAPHVATTINQTSPAVAAMIHEVTAASIAQKTGMDTLGDVPDALKGVQVR